MRRSDPLRRASLRAAARVGRTRRPATSAPEEWPSPSSGGFAGGRDRTRLTRRLAPACGGWFGGSNRDKYGLQGTTVWIFDSAVAYRRRPRSLALVADAQWFAAVTRDRE